MRRICRVIFSRYFISALFIAADVLLVSLFVLYASLFSYYSYIILGVVAAGTVAVFFHVIGKDTSPEYKLPWVVLIFALPVVGVLIYLLFSRRRMSREENRRINRSAFRLSAFYDDSESFRLLEEESRAASGRAFSIAGDDPLAQVYRGTHSRFYPAGEELFADLLFDLKAAKRFIFLEYFIIAQGKLWDEIHRVLLHKVRLGVEVRVMYDDIGCMRTLPASYAKRLNEEGILCRRFAPVTPTVTVSHNNRDHRKICVVDGVVGYTGGVNLADEYANVVTRFGYWKDGGLRLEGAAVNGLTGNFLALWDLTTGTESDYGRYLPPVDPTAAGDGGYYIPFASGPAPFYPRPVGLGAFRSIIDGAVSRVRIATPYLVVDHELTESLCAAARRGVDVRIITPGVADKKAVKVMTKSAYAKLIASGVVILEYLPGFIHEKALVADREYAVVGTLNFDFRSFIHHFEDAVWMFRTETVAQVDEDLAKTEQSCRRVTSEDAKLSRLERIVYNVVRIFRPLL